MRCWAMAACGVFVLLLNLFCFSGLPGLSAASSTSKPWPKDVNGQIVDPAAKPAAGAVLDFRHRAEVLQTTADLRYRPAQGQARGTGKARRVGQVVRHPKMPRAACLIEQLVLEGRKEGR